MNKTNNNNIVTPEASGAEVVAVEVVDNKVSAVEVVTPEASAVEVSNINLNTYHMLTPLFKSLIISTTNNGKYNLSVSDSANGFYFVYSEANLNIKVPLTAVFNTNDKISGILGIAFSTAKECPSKALGLCQLPDTALCYALTGEKQGTKKSYNYLMGMDSYKNGLLSVYYWNLFKASPEVRAVFKAYCKYYNIDTLRFNLKGDFKDVSDIKIIDYLASIGLNMTGYTARDDLREHLFDLINSHDNIILNGSNIMYSNHFKTTNSIKHLLTAPHQCKGGCLKNGCLNCYKLKGAIITVLIHGSQAGTDLNTPDNCYFISEVFKLWGLNISPEALSRGKNIYRNLKRELTAINGFESIPKRFLKTNKHGELIFEGQGAVINFLRYVLKSSGVNPEDIKGGI